jgi:hypothetical protein
MSFWDASSTVVESVITLKTSNQSSNWRYNEHFIRKDSEKKTALQQMGYKIKSIWGCEFQGNVKVNDIIKCNNKYRMISNGEFAFKDILAFQPPNTSFDKFLKAFDTKSQKGIFPHKVSQNLSKFLGEHPDLKQYSDNVIQVLKHSPIPSKKWFYNDLRAKRSQQKSIMILFPTSQICLTC